MQVAEKSKPYSLHLCSLLYNQEDFLYRIKLKLILISTLSTMSCLCLNCGFSLDPQYSNGAVCECQR